MMDAACRINASAAASLSPSRTVIGFGFFTVGGPLGSNVLQDAAPDIAICHCPKEASCRDLSQPRSWQVPIDAFHRINRRVVAHQNFADGLHIVQCVRSL